MTNTETDQNRPQKRAMKKNEFEGVISSKDYPEIATQTCFPASREETASDLTGNLLK